MRTRFSLPWAVLAVIVNLHLGLCRAAETQPPPDRNATPGERSNRVATKAKRVNLNTASQADLEALAGISPATARAIIQGRPFRSVNGLTNVSGITPAKLATLKPHVTVSRARATSTGRAAAAQGSSARDRLGKPTPGSIQKINLNTATKEQLESLPGIGPTRAQAIIGARPFKSVGDVMKVKGIKEGVFNKIKDQITVE